MCGIAGIAVSRRSPPDGLRDGLATMAYAMRARGPDDEGIFVATDDVIGLTTRRLAIRDLSPTGHMPMQNPDGTLWITYNGELYNSDDLRIELQQQGYAFRSTSDTEVILYGYEAWGVGVLNRMRGMFALGIYDQRDAPALLLARDQLGIKPLYYVDRPHTFTFASECKALRASGCASAELDPAGLVAYLDLGSVPAPLTIFRDVHALEAGHYLRLTWNDRGEPRAQPPARYWRLPEAPPSQRSYADSVEMVRGTLLDSVSRHLVSDVPLGAFLSGGLDSSTIVALMREASPAGTIRTCSVVFEEESFSEEAYAQAVADTFATDHVNVLVRPGDVEADLEGIIRAMDQPSNDGVNSYIVSKAARQAGLTVALSGLGGDELFGGYPTFQRLPDLMRMMQLVETVPGGSRLAGALLARWGQHRPAARLAGWLRSIGPLDARGYLAVRGLFSSRVVSKLVRPDVLAKARSEFSIESLVSAAAAADGPVSPREAVSRLELTCYMRHQLLRDTDVMSMAHSLEVRVPFVDRCVVEALFGVALTPPPGGLPKQALRDAMTSVPGFVRNRPEKQGFTFPFAAWMNGPLKPRLNELVECVEGSLSDYLQPRACKEVLDAFRAGEAHWSRAWALAALACVV